MTKPLHRFLLLLAFLLLGAPLNAVAELQGEIRLSTGGDGVSWVGQEVELRLDLWSDGFSFGDQLFQIPGVRGGYLLQADSSTVKLNESRDDIQWQGLRYTLLFYPQKAGRLEIPSFDVSFSASAGYGTEPTLFARRTEPVFVEARMPPGVEPGSLLVTTTDFSMRYSWTPDSPDDGPLQLKVGDALTLSVNRKASDVPGMVFAPLPDFVIDGLTVYPDTPQVKDQINRGELNGQRSDSITFICERAGEYEIPEIRFQWWDPERQEMAQETIGALAISVAVNPAYAASGMGESGAARSWKPDLGVIAAVVVMLLVLVYAGYRFWPLVSDRLEQRRAEYQAGERWAFEQAEKACKSGTPAAAYFAISLWLGRFNGNRPQPTILEWARESEDEDLLRESRQLQECVAGGSAGDWSGRKLGQLLAQHRNHPRYVAQLVEGLHPLNPPPVRDKSTASG